MLKQKKQHDNNDKHKILSSWAIITMKIMFIVEAGL